MAKHTMKHAKKRRSKSQQTRVAKPQKTIIGLGSAAQPSAQTKAARVIAMLQSSAGATITTMTQETGWQPHSVRGFLAGVVRKKLKLNLRSSKVDGQRTYRIHPDGAASGSARASKRRPD